MKKMLKRADGSYSQRGLWDNIRANKGSGKEPTKDMLKQEKKIKSEKQTGGPDTKKSDRVKARSEKVLGKAKTTWTKAEALKKFGNESSENMVGDKFANPADKANQLYRKAERQGNRAKNLKEKSEYLKTIGKKTGGKKNSWLEESKELKFGGGKKRMGGKNC